MSWLVSAAKAGAASASNETMSARKRIGMASDSSGASPTRGPAATPPPIWKHGRRAVYVTQGLSLTILTKLWVAGAIIYHKSVVALRKTKACALPFKRNCIADMVPCALGGGERKDDLQSLELRPLGFFHENGQVRLFFRISSFPSSRSPRCAAGVSQLNPASARNLDDRLRCRTF